ncbi:MAG: ATP-binding protein [Deltaproteobacteria bacterium]|nr:ATP-binding protein [Deltaproteobacteria bacterium]
MIPRVIKLPIGKKSFFLFGPRQVGKSTLVRKELAQKYHIEIDLLKRDEFLKYRLDPALFRSEIEFAAKNGKKFIVFIDEIQKLPFLLDEIHYLIEKFKGQLTFILTGSSARKLKRSSVNMLAGRAWEFRLYPFTFMELGDAFHLNDALLKGTLPPIVHENPEDAFFTLKAYTQTYLKEEILDEALVRNVEAFGRFLDIAADQSGRIVNYSTIGRDTGVSGKNIKNYYQILEDTLIAIRLEPYLKSARKRLVRHPKYYLFDIGVINSLCSRITPRSITVPTVLGNLFEHFIILETKRLVHYGKRPAKLFHWRSSQGAEVDLIIEEEENLFAVEIKTMRRVKKADLRGLRSFCKDYPQAIPMCVSICDRPYTAGEIPVLPWRDFFHELDLV